LVTRFHIGNEPAFVVPEYHLTGPRELLLYLGLGILAGVVGVIVIKTLYAFEDFFDELKIPFWSKPLLGGLILGAIGLAYPQTLGVGYEAVTEALQQQSSLALMAALIGLKIICTSLTLAAGGSGGVFAPSLFIGAMLGGTYGYLVNGWFPDITGGYGAYALVGMAALFSATGRATFTAIVILFEMTLDYSIILPLMFVCVTADQVAWALLKDSIYSLKLRRKGLNFINDIAVNVMSITLGKDIMTTELHLAYEGFSLKEAADKLLQHGHSVYPVVNQSGQLTGILTKEKLEKAALKHPKQLVVESKQEVRAVVHAHETVFKAVTKIEKTRDPRVLVVEPKTHKLLGIVSPIDFVRLSSAEAD
jgi:CIC family chloride channel protein